MALFIKVHDTNDSETYYINADKIEAIRVRTKGSAIYFVGSNDDVIHVAETAQEILEQIKFGGAT